MRRAAYFRNGVVAGVLTMGACHSLREDIMGQERTMELVRVAWMPWYWSVPIAILMLVYVAWILIGFGTQAEKDDAS